MVVKIYGTVLGVCTQRVMQCLIEKGVEFEIIHVDLKKGEQKTPEYMAKQPFGQVPYIVDGDLELFESRAILRYYAAKYADRGSDLLGRTLEEKARVDMWVDVEAINFNPHVFPIIFNLFVLPNEGITGNKAEALASAEKLDQVLEIYERQLSKTKYLAGDECTLADLTHIPALRSVVENCGMAHLISNKKHVKAWWADITSRPAWKKVMAMVQSQALSYSP